MEEDCRRCQQWCPHDPEGSGTQVTGNDIYGVLNPPCLQGSLSCMCYYVLLFCSLSSFLFTSHATAAARRA